MIKVEDIRSLTDFQRHTREHLDRLKRTGRPQVLTVNGQAEVVVQHAVAYQRLVEELERARATGGPAPHEQGLPIFQAASRLDQ